MIRHVLVLLLAATAAAAMSLATISSVLACSCASLAGADNLAHADVAFVGVVTEQSPGTVPEPQFRLTAYTFVVEEVRKGPVARSVIVLSSQDGASCGAGFAVADRWLVFARLQDGALSSGLCDGNERLAANVRPLPPAPSTGAVDQPGVGVGWTTWLIAGATVAAGGGVLFVAAARARRQRV